MRLYKRWCSGTQSGDVAQLGERQLCKLDVAGSIPVISRVGVRVQDEIDNRIFVKTHSCASQ